MDFFAWLMIIMVGGVSIANSIKVMKPDTEALVERLGQYKGTKLEPGVNFIFPILDRVVFQESLTQKIWDIPAQECITHDNVSINVDAVVSWRIVDIQNAYYKVENLQSAMATLIQTQIRSEMGKLDLDQIFAHRIQINETLLHELNSATDFWGVKVIQVELRDIVVNA